MPPRMKSTPPGSLRKMPSSGYPGYGKYVDPARFWGETLSLPEIYSDYADVLGDDHAKIQRLHLSKKRPGENWLFVQGLFEELAAAHPELPLDVANSEAAIRHVVYGCVSKFCADDIRFFLTKPPAGSDLSWRRRKLEVERRAGGWHFEWCASFETLDKIESRLMGIGSGMELFPCKPDMHARTV
jgi:hypothetical protein